MLRTRYLIIGYSRSGTTVTHLALMGHPNVAALTDELKPAPFFTKGISTFTHGNDPEYEKEKGYSALFDALTLICSNENTMAHGAKVACNYYKLAEKITEVVQHHLTDLKVIIVVRKDLVAQLGSALSGKKSGIMHSWYKGFEKRKVRPIKIPKWRFTAYATNVFRMYNALKALKKTHDVLEVNYEDLLTEPDLFYNKLFSFLDVPAITPSWLKSKKVMPPPEQYIKNYEPLQARLRAIETGSLPFYILFVSRLINHLVRTLRLLKPQKKKKRT